MADGRMINRSISHSRKVWSLASDAHRMLFACTIAHLDRDGRITADPSVWLGIVAPLARHLDEVAADECIRDFLRVGLAETYVDASGRAVLVFPGFREEQRWMRYDREAPSRFGAPPRTKKKPSGGGDLGPNGNSGSAPEEGRSTSGGGPEEGRTGSGFKEEKRREEKRARAPARRDPLSLDDAFRDVIAEGGGDALPFEIAEKSFRAFKASTGLPRWSRGPGRDYQNLDHAVAQLTPLAERDGVGLWEVCRRSLHMFAGDKGAKAAGYPLGYWTSKAGELYLAYVAKNGTGLRSVKPVDPDDDLPAESATSRWLP